MQLTNGQKYLTFQAIQDKLFTLQFKIQDYEKLEQTNDMAYHIRNLKKDQTELREVKDMLQKDIYN